MNKRQIDFIMERMDQREVSAYLRQYNIDDIWDYFMKNRARLKLLGYIATHPEAAREVFGGAHWRN